jgi:WD40 repeat protein
MPEVKAVEFSPQHHLVAWLRQGWNSNSFGLLDAVSGDEVLEQTCIGPKPSSLTWAADGTQLLIGEPGGTVHLWDVTSARSTKEVHLL